MDALKLFLNKSDRIMRRCKRFEGTSVFLTIVIGSVVLLLAWASVAEIDRVVRTEGRIVPTGRSRPIQHLEGGIISEIATREGASVKKGDLLLTIDATSAEANLNENKIKLVSQRAHAARLEAEASGASDISFPADLADKASCNAERNLFLSRKKKLDMDLLVHQETVRQQSAELNNMRNRKEGLTKGYSIAQKRAQMLASMAEHKAASQMELLEAQGRESQFETEIRDAENAVPKIQAMLAAEEARIGTIKAEFRAAAQAELVTVLADIERLNQTMTSVADRMNRTEIHAPIDGVINRMVVSSVGAVVKPGEIIIELTPTSDEVLIEARVMPKDRGDLRPGLKANIRVSAYDVGALGGLSGLLTEISADTMQDARGEPYYLAKILVNSVSSAYADKPLLPGMTVSGDLVTGRRTFLSHILSPMRKFSSNMFRDAR